MPPPLVALVIGLLMWVAARFTPFLGLDGGLTFGPGASVTFGPGASVTFGPGAGLTSTELVANLRGWQVGAALALGLIGVGVTASAAGLFFKAKTTVHPEAPEKATTLVMGGIYRFTRNPMYLGMLLVLLGWAIYLGNFLSLGVAFLFVVYMNRYQIWREELALTANFGEAYEAYCARVRRWL